MADHVDRIEASYADTLAVEHVAPGMVSVVTIGDEYTVDCRDEVCTCPDYEYNLEGQGRCKHIYAALRETDQLPVDPVHGFEESLTEREQDTTPAVATDGGVECDLCQRTDLGCFEHYEVAQ